MTYVPIDVSELKIIEVEGLTIHVDNDQAGEAITKALKSAEIRKWYLPAAEKVIMYGKQSVKSGKIKIIALDLEYIEPNADSIIYYTGPDSAEIRISTINARSLQEKLIHEFTHAVGGLANPHQLSYSPKVSEYKEKLLLALNEDYEAYKVQEQMGKFVPVQNEAARLIFKLPETYPVTEQTAEHICFGLQALVFDRKASESIAPRYTNVLQEYINYEISQKIANQQPGCSSTTYSVVNGPKALPLENTATALKPPSNQISSTSNLPAPTKNPTPAAKTSVPKYPVANVPKASPPVKMTLKPPANQIPPSLNLPASTTRQGPVAKIPGPTVKTIYPDEIYIPPKKPPLVKQDKVITISAQPNPPPSASVKAPFPKVIKIGGTSLITVFHLYNHYQEGNEYYSYLKDENPVLHRCFATGAEVTRAFTLIGAYSRLPLPALPLLTWQMVKAAPDIGAKVDSAWAKLTSDDFVEQTPEVQHYNLIWHGNPEGPCQGLKPEKIKELGPGVLALNTELKNQPLKDTEAAIKSFYDSVDVGSKVDSAWAKLTSDDFVEPTPEEQDYNLIWHGNHRGPCQGLKPEKIKELGPGVLALNPGLKNQPFLIDIEAGFNFVDTWVKKGVYRLFDEILGLAGFSRPNPNPAEDYRSISALKELKGPVDTVIPVKRVHNNSDIITQTLASPPQLNNTASTADNNTASTSGESYNFEQHQSSIQEFAKATYNPKASYAPNVQNSAYKDKKSWEFGISATAGGGGLTAYLDVLNLSWSSLVGFGLFGLVALGFINIFISQREQERREKRQFIVENQCEFTVKEIEKSFKKFKKAIKAITKYQNAEGADKAELLVKAKSALSHALEYSEYLLKKYEHLAHGKGGKFHTQTTYRETYHGLGFLQFKIDSKGGVHIIFPRNAKEALNNCPEVTQHYKHTPRTETIDFIKKHALPELKKFHESLKEVLPQFIDYCLHELSTDYEINDNALQQKRIAYESGRISEEEYNAAVSKHIQYFESSNQILNEFSYLLPEQHIYRDRLTTYIQTNEDIIEHTLVESVQVRLYRDCNVLANQYHTGIISEAVFANKVEERVGIKEGDEKSFWDNFIQENKAVYEKNSCINEFCSHYIDYHACMDKIDKAVEDFKQGKINKEAFIKMFEELNIERLSLTAIIEQIGENSGDKSMPQIGENSGDKSMSQIGENSGDKSMSQIVKGFKVEFAHDENYYSYLLNETLVTVYNNHISSINELQATHKKKFASLSIDYEKGIISEDEYIEKCTQANAEICEKVTPLAAKVCTEEFCSQEVKEKLNHLLASFSSDDEIHEQIIYITLNQANEGSLAASFAKVDQHLHLIKEQDIYCRGLLAKALFSYQYKDFTGTNTAATKLLELNPQDHNAFSLLINAHLQIATPKNELLSLINHYKHAFTNKSEKIINNYYEAIVKNEVEALAAAFEESREHEDPNKRLYYMTNIQYARERLLDEKRIIAMKIAHPDAVKMLEINKWLELFIGRTLQVYSLKQAIANEEDSETKEKLKGLLAETEAFRDDAAQNAAKQIYYENNAGNLRLLNLLSYGHLATDAFLHLFSEKIKSAFPLSDNQFKLVKETVSSSVRLTSSYIYDTLQPIKDTYLSSVGGFTPEQVSDFKKITSTETTDGFIKASKKFLDKYNTPVLAIKLATVLGNLYLQSKYESDVQHLLDKPSFHDWLHEHSYSNFLSKVNSVIGTVADGFILIQQLLSLYSLFSNKANKLTLIHRVSTLFLNLSYVHQFIHYMMRNKNGERSTNRLYIFYTLLMESMKGSELQQLISLHEDTVLMGIQELLQRMGWFKLALMLESRWVQNSLYALRSLDVFSKVFNAINATEQEYINNKIYNLRLKFLEIDDLLKNAEVENDKKQIMRKAADMYCDLKYELFFMSKEHDDCHALYVYALFSQHLLNETIEIVPTPDKSNSLFNAVSAYTVQSAAELMSLCAEESSDSLKIKTLSNILKRPIILIFKGPLLDLNKQDLLKPGAISSGDPIFVFHDEENAVYYGALLREELYFEQTYHQKLAHKVVAPIQQPAPQVITPSKISQEEKAKSKEMRSFIAGIRAQQSIVASQYNPTHFAKSISSADKKAKTQEMKSFLAGLRQGKSI